MANLSKGGLRLREGIKKNSPEKPLVSIITVILNLFEDGREEFFRQMMTSIASQDYGRRSIEHLIIDGGSNDQSIELIHEYDNKGAIDYWVSEPDSGVYSAMNKGLAASAGTIINFMNSDDYFSVDAVSRSVQALLTNSADFSYSKTRVVDRDNNLVRNCWLSSPEFFYFGMPGCHQSMFVKKDWFDNAGPFDESFRIYADWNFMLKIFLSGAIPTFIDEYLVMFRSEGISDNWYENPIAQSEKSRIIKENYLDSIRLDEVEVRALEKFLIHPLSNEYEQDEIQQIYLKCEPASQFFSDCQKLLVYSILNRKKDGVHGLKLNQAGQRSEIAENDKPDNKLTRWVYGTTRRILKQAGL